MKLDLAITGIGMLTPVGHSAAACMHAVRSGVTRLSLQPYPDRTKKAVVGGIIMKRTGHGRVRRLAAFAEMALRQALQQTNAVTGGTPEGPFGVLFGGPEAIRPGYGFPESHDSAESWIRQLGIGTISHVELMKAGACSTQLALQRAAELLAAGVVRACFIVVVDTQLDIRTIRWHEDHHRLKRADMTDGLMPAEAACCLLVEADDGAARSDARVIARLLATAAGRESATILSDQPNTASGLTTAVAAALTDAAVKAADVGMVWSDLNGESYRAREWAFTEIRSGIQTHTRLMHPADCHGDLGAASDANLLALAAWSQATGWSEGKPLLVFSGSEDGLRAATVLAPATDRRHFLQVSRELPTVFSTRFKLPAPPVEPIDFSELDDPQRAYFDWQLREEHRDEIAALYYQRRALLRDSTLSWRRARLVEQRMLDHLDGVVVSGSESMAAMAQGVRSDDEGTSFAGALMIAVLPHDHNLALIDAVFAEPSAANLVGIGAALRQAPDDAALAARIDQWLGHADPAVQAMAASLASNRRTGNRVRIVALLASAEPATVVAAANAAWRLGIKEATSGLQALLQHAHLEVRAAALNSLLCLAPAETAAYCRARIVDRDSHDAAVATCLATAGNLEDAHLLMQAAGASDATPSDIKALGILGALHAVPLMLDLLGGPDDPIKVAAGEALELISGSRLRERIVAATPEPPAGEGSEEPDAEIERVATSPAVWADWWHRSRSRMAPSVRWRRGAPFELGQCLADLADETATLANRERAHVELVTHSGNSIPFEPDWFVARQERALAAWQSWWWQTSSR